MGWSGPAPAPPAGEAKLTRGVEDEEQGMSPKLNSGIAVINPGGSLEATRRSFNKDFLLALAADFKKHGAAAIEKVREQQPAAYMKICALLVPREMKSEHAGGLRR